MTYKFGGASRRCVCARVGGTILRHGSSTRRGLVRVVWWYGVRCAAGVGLHLGAASWGCHLGRVAWRVVAGAGAGRHGRRGAVVVVGHVAWRRGRILWCVHVGGAGESQCANSCAVVKVTGMERVEHAKTSPCASSMGGGARAVTASPGRVAGRRVSSLAVVTGSVWWSSDGGEEKGNPGLSTAHLVKSDSGARVCQKDPV